MRTWNVLRLLAACLLCYPALSPAAPLASPEEDRKAKQALPPSGKALVYVYRTDGGARVSPTVSLNNRELGALAPRTYYMVPVTPGRLDLRAGDGPALSIRSQEGRVYFVQLTVSSAGDGQLTQVSYGRGRQDVHAARLARADQPTAPAKRDTSGEQTGNPPAAHSGFSLIVKGGSFSLASASQSVLATNIEMDAAAAALGVEAEWITAGGWAFGAEYLSHTRGYTSTAGDGDLTIATVMLNMKKYFRYGTTVQPYLGIGAGGAAAAMSGGISGGAGGFAAQAMGGVAFRGDHFGVYTEVKYQSAKAEDDNGEGVDIGGVGLFAGISAQF